MRKKRKGLGRTTQSPGGKNAAKRGCAGPAKITSRLRYDPKSAVELTAEEVAFGAAMRAYLDRWRPASASGPTCSEVLEVALDLGYSNGERDFTKMVGVFTAALHRYSKTQRRLFPAWSEVLLVLTRLGYKKPSP